MIWDIVVRPYISQEFPSFTLTRYRYITSLGHCQYLNLYNVAAVSSVAGVVWNDIPRDIRSHQPSETGTWQLLVRASYTIENFQLILI